MLLSLAKVVRKVLQNNTIDSGSIEVAVPSAGFTESLIPFNTIDISHSINEAVDSLHKVVERQNELFNTALDKDVQELRIVDI